MKWCRQLKLIPHVLWVLVAAAVATGPRRCCEVNQVLSFDNHCVNVSNAISFSPPFSLDSMPWSLKPLSCPEDNIYLQLDETQELNITNGLLIWKDIGVFEKTTSDYCVGVGEEGKYKAVVCYPDIEKICKTKQCVPKCCPKGEVLHSQACVKNDHEFSPPFDTSSIIVPRSINVHAVEHIPKCSDFMSYFDPASQDEDKFLVLQNGSLYHMLEGRAFEPGSYCVEYNLNASVYQAFYCAFGLSQTLEEKNLLQKVGLFLSCAFLVLTITYHFSIKKLRDMQGLCFLCHMISLLVGDGALLYAAYFTKKMSKAHCITNGLIQQYGFLATFFWLNVMCFDVWRVIKATVSMVPLSDILANDARKFRHYFAYAFGVPFAIVGVTVVLQFLPKEYLPSNSIYRPGFGISSCWFRGETTRLYFFYGPIALISLLNLIYIGHTIVMLSKAGGAFNYRSEKASITSFKRNHLHEFWQRFSLFCVSVVCWVTEVLSWKIPPPEIWIATDIINSLQGFIVFIIFITCKKKRQLIYRTFESTMSSVVTRATKTFSRSHESSSGSERGTNEKNREEK